ncbi:hypothetical protein [Microbulbifer sp. ARAS458-1]|uniref:hypothetical protein n=1 Tax=Microbulbifer sp. ARAS458-1 TaxID=3140242 RepID=UPI003877A24E
MNVNMEKFVEGLHSYLSKQIQPLADRVKNLEQGGSGGKSSAKILFDSVRELIDKRQKPLLKRIEDLESKLESIESKGLDYCGTYQRALRYERGDVVTHKGSMWVHVYDSSCNYEPGSSPYWQLAVKGVLK